MSVYQQRVQFQGTAVVTLRWPDFISIVLSKGLKIQYVTNSDSYTIFSCDESISYVCNIIYLSNSVDFPFDSDYSRDQNDLDLASFESNYKLVSNANLRPRTIDGRIKASIEKSDSTRINFYSHDWTDPTTWYQQSVEIIDEIPTTNDHTVYQLSHVNIIDLYHGLITLEDNLKDSNGHSFRVKVKVNGVTKTEVDPHYGDNNPPPNQSYDYKIDYSNGRITFLSPIFQSDDVLVTYHYATSSLFKVVPAAGKKFSLVQAEVQFSTDVNMTDSIILEVWGVADYFYPPSYIGNGQGQIPSGTKIILQKFIYKALSDFQNDAFKSYTKYDAMGDPSNWRSQKQAVTVFDWDYVASNTFQSSKGMEMRLYLHHDKPFDGWMSTATLYCISESDV